MPKLIHFSDLHAIDRHYEFVIRESQKYDLVCISGDLLDLNEHKFPGNQLNRVISYLKKIHVPLALCSGNHDSAADSNPRLFQAQWLRDLKSENIYVDGDTFAFGGHTFRCHPWQGRQMRADANDIWLIHAPPDRTKTSIVRGGICFGDQLFGDQCRTSEGPKLALCGHIHEAISWRDTLGRTVILNPLVLAGAARPNYNIVDLDHGVALHYKGTGETDVARLR